VEQADEFGITPLMQAVERADLECMDMLIAAGADVDHVAQTGSVLSHAETREIVQRLLDAGADPRQLSHEGRRALCGLGEVSASVLAAVSQDEYRRAVTRVFGRANPERLQEPFWEAMVRAGVSAFEAGQSLGCFRWPVWCAQRFGQSLTFLPDGRVVQIGGEHEDFYDDDFCIYNDVFVHGLDGSIVILGYPEAVFPPTDFHTATLIDDAIYVIGSLGYVGTRRFGETPVYRLDVKTFRMERIDAPGEAPGWIFEHRALRVGSREICVSGGKIATTDGGKEAHTANPHTFVLDVERRLWRRERGGSRPR
jgi:ankyrin repeat protein